MARRRASDAPRNDFEQLMQSKAIEASYLATRWSKDVRRINQIRNKPLALHIDAIKGIHKRRPKQSPYEDLSLDELSMAFEEVMGSKVISPEFLAERWGLSVRRINQIRRAPEAMHVDAIKGIPVYRKKLT